MTGITRVRWLYGHPGASHDSEHDLRRDQALGSRRQPSVAHRRWTAEPGKEQLKTSGSNAYDAGRRMALRLGRDPESEARDLR